MAAPHPTDPPWQSRHSNPFSSWYSFLFLLLLACIPLRQAQGEPSHPAPFSRFDVVPAIGRWLTEVASREGSFSVGSLGRAQNAYLAGLLHPATPPNPSSMDVRAMFSSHHCRAGRIPLPRGDNALLLPGFVRLHRGHCGDCAARAHGFSPRCYFAQLHRCLSHGFDPPRVTTAAPQPLYTAKGPDGNHPSTEAFSEYVGEQVTKLVAGGVIHPAPPYTIQAPLGVAIPPSKAQAAYSLTGVAAADDASYAQAKSLLARFAPGFADQFKRRLISDHSAPGLNAQMDLKAFRYINIDDMVALLQPGAWVAVADVVAYYHNFPLALEARHLFGLRWRGLAYVWARLSFGGSAHPYLASVITAEVVAGLRGMGIPTVAMIDDFGVVGQSRALAASRLQVLCAVIQSLGLAVSPDKTQLGQQVKFIGFWLDTVRMVLSFDTASTAAFAEVLRQGLWCLANGMLWDHLFVLHVAGKLQHFASVVQAGRLRLSPLWAYARLRGRLSAAGLSRLMDDLVWWEERLRRWALGELGGGEFPILNSATILADPLALLIAVTDYSGPDGVGGYFGRVADPDPEVFSRQWDPGECPQSSLAGELFGLFFLLRRLATRDRPPVCKVLLWVTDNMGAAFVVNAGRCSDDHDGLVLLRLIFDVLERLGWFVVALWHPRESNTLADFYSHLSRYLDVADVSTTVSRVAALQGPRAPSDPDQGCRGGAAHMDRVCGVVRPIRPPASAMLPDGGRVPLRLRGAPARVDAVRGPGQGPSAEARHPSQDAMAIPGRLPPAGGAHPPDAVRGPHCRSQDGPPHDAPPQPSVGALGYVQPGGPGAGCHPEDGAARPPPRGGGDQWTAWDRRELAQGEGTSRHPPPTHQARAHWCRAVRHRRAGRARPVLGSAPPAPAVASPGPGRQPDGVRVPSDSRGARRPDAVFLGTGTPRAREAGGERGGSGSDLLREPFPPGRGHHGPALSRRLRDGGAEDGEVGLRHV